MYSKCLKSKLVQWMSENRMFGLENLTKFGLVIQRSECSVCFRFVQFIFSAKLDSFIYKTILHLCIKWSSLALKNEPNEPNIRNQTVWELNNFQKCRNPNVRLSDIYCIDFRPKCFDPSTKIDV